MQRVYTGESDKAGYDNMITYDDGSHIYYNDNMGSSEELNRIFSRAWDSLPKEKQLEINNKIEEKQRKNNETRRRPK
ncbi:MAG: hypothetical protein RSD88_07430 [Anaerovoracaceae bacterium]